ncbi:uncharacterized protein BDZ99DRAFT_474280 [Mytilinidion resinicola]|uniref:ZZ-type domain-containing protein n=1 Tax=Mytilinidion resinicola TaxID=574789 RepID=A0A6A6YSZ4_9PEZI|nr:uncharacterized protein BDZ99DRAFT_474280 [Mytilinidion resinicola]KAF2812042.1 hypothetical protein BDZ99DRAFT_474280 [Mytilinidion resinicola]
MATNVPVTLDTLITIKIAIQGSNRKFKIPLRDLGAHVLPDKLRALLAIPAGQDVVFERYSDSAGAYITLDSDNAQVYKTLFRAAKAKLKLRLRAIIVSHDAEPSASAPAPAPVPAAQAPSSRYSLDAPSFTTPPVVPALSPPTIARSCVPPRPGGAYNYSRMAAFNKAMSEMNQLATPQQPAVDEVDAEGEAPVPRAFTARENFFTNLNDMPRAADLAFRMKDATPPPPPSNACSWVVYCNNCDNPMANEHFHCSICDRGDYDLCASCVDAGIHCPGAGHWMVKRFVKNGTVVNSTTERIGPKAKVEPENDMPGAFTEEKKPEIEEQDLPTRTCNCCVKGKISLTHLFPENEFVTCTSCEDFDLCMDCHVSTKHGHHPGHAFKAATPDTSLTALADFLCSEGRNVRHAAVCDGCEKFIYGVRHKCLNCPDWDYCSTCIESAKFIHPQHRFVPIYEPLPEPRASIVRHYGIYCDGPLCKDKESQSHIEGVRYKCAVCHDTDFCANCEAIPANRHNRTHPLIKFKTPVRNVSVTTMGEDRNGSPMTTMGDLPARRSTATETVPVAPSANAATQVQTIVDMKPVEARQSKPKIEIKDLLAKPIQEKIRVQNLLSTPPPVAKSVEEKEAPAQVPKVESSVSELAAYFVRDTMQDGTKVAPGSRFIQVWTLRNPGPRSWPAGCSVRYVGGDNMLNVDNSHPSSDSDLAEATESNVIGRPVEKGEEISFRVLMKAPQRESTHISYWRLKAPDGTPFGHRLWCHIDVSEVATTPASPPTFSPATPPPMSTTTKSEYELQLFLLEQNNKKRYEATRKEASVKPAPMDPIAAERRLLRNRLETLRTSADLNEVTKMSTNQQQEYGMSLMILEWENKIRALVQRSHELEQGLESATEESAEKTMLERKLFFIRRELEAHTITLADSREKMARFKDESKAKKQEQEQEQQQDTVSPPQEPTQELRSKGSVMIFPQLPKESPESSTHEAQANNETEAEEKEAEEGSEEDFFEDAESVEMLEGSSDDGFLTDEEYDILDASDEEQV